MQTGTSSSSPVYVADSWPGRVTRAEIDLDAAMHNITSLMSHIGEKVKFMAVVKANAYGHGAVPLAQTAVECGAHYLAVACADEGVELRRAGIETPVLVMGYSQPSEMATFVEYGLTATINDLYQAQALENAAASARRRMPIHFKVESGMNRYGCYGPELVPLAQAISRMSHIDIEGLFTHFARSDEANKSWALQQFERYQYARDNLRRAGFQFRLCHTSNSAAVIDLPETHLDMVRSGTAMYGMYPSVEVSRFVPLNKVLTLKSKVGRVHELQPGDGVSYGYTYVAESPTRVALMPVGYGDGYRRALSNIAPVIIHGKRAQIVGRVCMDQAVCNVSEIEDIQLGDDVVLIGRQGDQEVTAEELGTLTGTINYEVTTWLTARVPRLFIRGGKCIGYSDLNTRFSLWA